MFGWNAALVQNCKNGNFAVCCSVINHMAEVGKAINTVPWILDSMLPNAWHFRQVG
ncbi:Uncharacterised protein [Serratia liquefaciens]|nr:Uncharacterised protein [Serratia liquefaciens]CAI1944004.1 Uncharacterised protein [Serratia liquefaciens]